MSRGVGLLVAGMVINQSPTKASSRRVSSSRLSNGKKLDVCRKKKETVNFERER